MAVSTGARNLRALRHLAATAAVSGSATRAWCAWQPYSFDLWEKTPENRVLQSVQPEGTLKAINVKDEYEDPHETLNDAHWTQVADATFACAEASHHQPTAEL
jgi:hypothetical protein